MGNVIELKCGLLLVRKLPDYQVILHLFDDYDYEREQKQGFKPLIGDVQFAKDIVVYLFAVCCLLFVCFGLR